MDLIQSEKKNIFFIPTALWCSLTPDDIRLLDRDESGILTRVDICFPLDVASAPPSLSGSGSVSPSSCLALAAARVALIASASAADASTRYSVPLFNILQKRRVLTPK